MAHKKKKLRRKAVKQRRKKAKRKASSKTQKTAWANWLRGMVQEGKEEGFFSFSDLEDLAKDIEKSISPFKRRKK
mgnify:FL=1